MLLDIDITHLLSLFAFNRDEPMLFTSGLFWVLFMVFLPLYAMVGKKKVWHLLSCHTLLYLAGEKMIINL